MEPKIRVDFRFLNQRIAASNDGYKNFVRDLIELHTFPSETWTSISKKEADGISQAVASIPSDIAEMSDRRAREVGQSSVANQLAERVVEGEKTRLENQQWFETRKGELDTHAARLDGLSGLLKQNVEDWTREKANELESWRDAFRTSFAVEAAHTYWAKTKFQRHSRIATQLMFVGIGYLVSVLAVLAGIIWMGRASKEPFWQAPVSIALPLALTLIVLIWLGRLLSRSYMAHAQLAEDAQERATFIETYIALIRAGVLDKSDAVEAHKAIFRPASLGLLSGDGATDTPIEVVSKAIAGGGPKT